MKHQAWLSAVPESKSKCDGPRLSRLQQYREQQGEDAPLLQLPELDAGEHLVDWLHRAGTVGHGAMGGVMALSWQELQAWDRLSGTGLTPWEAEAIMHLSQTYAAMSNKATKADCPAPYQPEDFDRDATADRIKQGLRQFAKNKKR